MLLSQQYSNKAQTQFTKRRRSFLVMNETANEIYKVLKYDLPKIDRKVIDALDNDFSTNKKSKIFKM